MPATDKLFPTAADVSLAAAHGITALTVATWNPNLLRTPRVLVPIELNVLMVRDAMQSWATTGMTPPPKAVHPADGSAESTVDAASLMPPLFAVLATPRPKGAYLQWYLPGAFTEGTADDTTNTLKFRPIPDRWLVLRISAGASISRRAVYGWVGLVPRKEIGMRREWVNAGLAAIAPTFRFGPVLVDPQHIRMPLPVDLNGTWVWDYRADAANWAENPATNATDDALMGQDPPTASEGWLKLNPPKAQGGGQ